MELGKFDPFEDYESANSIQDETPEIILEFCLLEDYDDAIENEDIEIIVETTEGCGREEWGYRSRSAVAKPANCPRINEHIRRIRPTDPNNDEC